MKRFLSLFLSLGMLISPLRAADPMTADEPVYDGAGMCIAVLDAGFDLEHECFALTTDRQKLTKEAVDAALSSLSVGDSQSCFISEKIPFAYDYGDGDTDVRSLTYHGTGMASIAAGNSALTKTKPAGSQGVAPEAQILAMKVYSDASGTAPSKAIVNAISDAVKLGADVILLSLAEPCGFEDSSASGVSLNEAVDAARAAGVIVTAPAGNVTEYGSTSIFARTYALSTTTTDQPDIGTISYPGSIPSVFCVGSADKNYVTKECLILPDGTKIPYNDSNDMFELPSGGKTFAEFFAGRELSYVITTGIGKPEELAAAESLEGKLAVVSRGELAFYEKAQNAALLGAIGMIVVDNQPDANTSLATNMDLTDAPIPAILISQDSAKLLEAAKARSFTADPGNVYTIELRPTPTPSSYSAWGTTPTLGIKPDVSVIAEEIPCATGNNSYTATSSTTAAAAKVAGMCVCVKQRVLNEFPTLSGEGISDRVCALIAGSAEPMLHNAASPYSVRAQGSGCAELSAALTSELLITSNGKHRIELGDGRGRYMCFPVTVENLSDTRKICTLEAVFGSDGIDDFVFADLDSSVSEGTVPLAGKFGKTASDTLAFTTSFTPFADADIMIGDMYGQINTAADDFKPHEFTIDPGERVTFAVSVYLDRAAYERYTEFFPNGFFLEGYVSVKDGESAVSIPYLGYLGNFASATALEADLYKGEQQIYDGRYLYSGNGAVMEHVLGTDPKDRVQADGSIAQNELIFSPSAGKSVYLNFALLRSVADVSVTVTDASGEIVSTREIGYVSRTWADSSGAYNKSTQIELWDGRADDFYSYVLPDGLYTVTVRYRMPTAERSRSFSYTLRIDASAPEYLSGEITENSGFRFLDIRVADNHRIAKISVYDSYFEDALPTNDGKYDITKLEGEYIYVELYDAAANRTVARIDNPGFDPHH